MKTKKAAIVLAVGLWAVLGGILFDIVRDARAEERCNENSILVSKIRSAGYNVDWLFEQVTEKVRRVRKPR